MLSVTQNSIEYILTHCKKPEINSYILSHPNVFDEVLVLAISDNDPIAWRAAWVLWSCISQNDVRLQKHLEQIITILPYRKDGHQRELMKIILEMDVPDDLMGKLFDVCSKIWMQLEKIPSVRYNAFRIMIMICKKYPELKNEVLQLTESYYIDTLSNGVKNSIQRIMRGL